VSVKSTTSSSITIGFNVVASADRYIIYSGKSSPTLTAIDTTTVMTYTHASLTSSTTYYYAVAAMNSSSTSEKSPVVSATTSAAAPVTPAGLTATTVSSTSISIKFNSVTGATGYKLYWSTNNSSFTLLTSLTSTTYTHNSLTSSTTYYYKVTSVNGSVESTQSNSVSAKTSAATKVAVIGSRCSGCGRCPSACDQKAISRSGSKYVIDPTKCTGCGSCVNVCPRDAITLK
jgi:NAD-dependent dihydropyrimidine dehydrogenase PreA subunit